jgi:hypothetical protein
VRSRAIGHLTASKPTSVGWQGPGPYDTWQRRSPPQPGGEVRSHMTRDSAGAHISREASYEEIKHMTAMKPTLTGRRGPELEDL